jgi:phenazine biosynthesis protein phzE
MYNKPFVISKKKWETYIKYFSWNIKEYESLWKIKENEEQIFVVPFTQAKERWFNVNSFEEENKIISIIVKEKYEYSFEKFSETFEEKDSILENNIKEYSNGKEYKNIVKDIVEREISNWEWANFLIAQKIEWKINNFDIEVALSIFKRLLEGDYWAYLHFIFFDGEKVFIWASPERNVSIEKNISNTEGKYKVRMNPISWTFKKKWYGNYIDFKPDFLDFLKDKKETDELFMATDEELKMMSSICTSWWMMVWPILKEMANLIHSEYLLSWNSDLNLIDIFRKSMWASTVVWSPVENAFNIVKKYEDFDRKYYAWAICHIDNWNLDSAIMIRTLHLDIFWKLEIYVWASLVKDSNPDNEYKELQIKLKWILNAVNSKKGEVKKSISFLNNFYLDDDVQELVQKRNWNLSKIWFFKQENYINEKIKGKKCLIINNEDDFTNMLAHLLKLMWIKVDIKRYKAPYLNDYNIESILDYDFVLIWPWPWNPKSDDKKMIKNLEIIDFLEKNNKKYFWICLWHQLICRYQNIKLEKKEIITQWEQIQIDFYGKKENVAFYNTFTWLISKNCENSKNTFSYNKTTWEIYALKSKNYFWLQFHPESILTQYWYEILEREIERIFN